MLIGISDSCFLCGILLVLFSLVCFISQSGLFDRAIYSFYTFRRIFRRKETKALPFEEYIQKHKGLKQLAACRLRRSIYNTGRVGRSYSLTSVRHKHIFFIFIRRT